MHKLLFSGLPPIGRSQGSKNSWNAHANYRDRWMHLASTSKEIDVCVGYISNDAVAELTSILRETSGDLAFHLSIGMAKFDGLPKSQFDALLGLQSLLLSRNIGSVNVVRSWPYHGKVSVFTNHAGKKSAIVGSSNLSGIVKGTFQYECDIEVEDSTSAQTLSDFNFQLRTQASQPLDNSIKIVRQRSSALNNFLGVELLETKVVEEVEEKRQRSKVVLEMPIKANSQTLRSNLNVFFGTGRANTQRTLVIPRPWYEAELQPGRSWYRTNPEFPKARQNFKVLTDDGYSFEVYSSYDESWDGQKNFRSDNDLQILGRWIKGRLEADGALQPGEIVTEEVLKSYGRNSITFTKLGCDNWFMDFGRG
jgi:hypothetical protein